MRGGTVHKTLLEIPETMMSGSITLTHEELETLLANAMARALRSVDPAPPSNTPNSTGGTVGAGDASPATDARPARTAEERTQAARRFHGDPSVQWVVAAAKAHGLNVRSADFKGGTAANTLSCHDLLRKEFSGRGGDKDSVAVLDAALRIGADTKIFDKTDFGALISILRELHSNGKDLSSLVLRDTLASAYSSTHSEMLAMRNEARDRGKDVDPANDEPGKGVRLRAKVKAHMEAKYIELKDKLL